MFDYPIVALGSGSTFASSNNPTAQGGSITRNGYLGASAVATVRVGIRANTTSGLYEMVVRRQAASSGGPQTYTTETFTLNSGSGSRFFGAFVRPQPDNPLRVTASVQSISPNFTAIGTYNTPIQPSTTVGGTEWGFTSTNFTGNMVLRLYFSLDGGALSPFYFTANLGALS